MNCQRAREIFPELLDSRTAATAHLDVRAHLASCPDCQRDFAALSQTAAALDAMKTPQPSPRLRKNFYAMLEEEKHSAASVRAATERRHRAQLWRWVLSPLVAAALLVLGFLLGKRTAPAATSLAPAVEDSTKRELALLREQVNQQNAQLNKMTTLVSWSIMQQQQNPANERLREVLAAAKAEKPNDKVLDDLIQAVTLDPNVNVRLRALEALYPHAERDVVRAGILAALPREQNPLMQLELIDFVATAQETEAAPVLERISADENANSTVRDAAKFALAQL
jgi:hypothetical protein